MRNARFLALLALFIPVTAFGQELSIQQDDLIIGMSTGDVFNDLMQVRGPSEEDGGELVEVGFSGCQDFVQSVEFDNLNGISHNPAGNIIGVNFGPSASGGTIYSLSTTGEAGAEAQEIGNTTGLGGDGLTLSQLGGLSISPDNSKIALVGYTSASIIVFDYTAGNSQAEGASLSGARRI